MPFPFLIVCSICTPAYMFNVYKNQPSRKTGSRNLMGPKTLPTIWHTNMKIVTKYKIPIINSCWAEKNATKNILRQTERQAEGRTDGRTEVKQYTPFRWSGGIRIPPPVERGYNKAKNRILLLYSKCNDCRIKYNIWLRIWPY